MADVTTPADDLRRVLEGSIHHGRTPRANAAAALAALQAHFASDEVRERLPWPPFDGGWNEILTALGLTKED